MALLGKRHARGPVRGELLIFGTNQQFATDRLAGPLGSSLHSCSRKMRSA